MDSKIEVGIGSLSVGPSSEIDFMEPSEINRNKRKVQLEELVPVAKAKHTCFSLQNQSDDIQLDLITNSCSADSVMSVSSSSVNCFETKTHDDISSSNFYTSPTFHQFSSSNALISNNSVLSSGRWNQDAAEQGTEKLTIDKEFEQYFSMLML